MNKTIFEEQASFCETYYIDNNEELMFVQIYADDNDVEGFIWEGNFGTEWVMRANGL